MLHIKQNTQVRWNRLARFKPQFRVFFETETYLVRTAESSSDLLSCFKLRHHVFVNEFRDLPGQGLDFDRYDFSFDHLMILEKSTGALVGTYRMNAGHRLLNSYTAQEFDLTEVSQMNEVTLELGRACIRKDHRKGSSLRLLWRGVAEYMKISGAEILVGCSSLKMNQVRDAALVMTYLQKKGSVSDSLSLPAKAGYKMRDFEVWSFYFKSAWTDEHEAEAAEKIPALLRTYLALGARVGWEPAYDPEFDCIDLVTVLRKCDLSRF